MLRLHHSQALMAGQPRGGIVGAGQNNEIYNDVFNLDGCCFVFVFVRDPGRAHKLEARKEAGQSRNERMGTVPLSEFSRHSMLETGAGGVP